MLRYSFYNYTALHCIYVFNVCLHDLFPNWKKLGNLSSRPCSIVWCPWILWYSSRQETEPNSPLLECELDLVTCFLQIKQNGCDDTWLQWSGHKTIPHCLFSLGSLLLGEAMSWGDSISLWKCSCDEELGPSANS